MQNQLYLLFTVILVLSYLTSQSGMILSSAFIYLFIMFFIGYYLKNKNSVLISIPTKQWEQIFKQFTMLTLIVQKIQLIQKLVPSFYRGDQQFTKIFTKFCHQYEELQKKIELELQMAEKKLKQSYKNQNLQMEQYVLNSQTISYKFNNFWKKYCSQSIFLIQYPEISIKTLVEILANNLHLKKKFYKIYTQASNLLTTITKYMSQVGTTQQKIRENLCNNKYSQDIQTFIKYLQDIKIKRYQPSQETFIRQKNEDNFKDENEIEKQEPQSLDLQFEISNRNVDKMEKKSFVSKQQFMKELNIKICRNYQKRLANNAQNQIKQKQLTETLQIPYNKKGAIYQAYTQNKKQQ